MTTEVYGQESKGCWPRVQDFRAIGDACVWEGSRRKIAVTSTWSGPERRELEIHNIEDEFEHKTVKQAKEVKKRRRKTEKEKLS